MTELTPQNPEFNDDDTDLNDEIEVLDEGIYEPFDPTKIRVDTRKITIDLILQRIKYHELNLAPDFQRKAIWTPAAKSKLIESILIRIPLPAFYIDATDDDQWVVIDGVQRLTALKEFILDQSLKLTELPYLRELTNCKFNELHRKYQRRILETELTLSVIEAGTPPEVKYNIFRRINTGGIPLTPQEIRHALNQGKVTEFLKHLSQLDEFIKVTKLNKSKKPERRIDQEFILGFLAYSLYDYKIYKTFKSRDVFFDNTMKDINKKYTEEELQLLENQFKKAMISAYEIFGNNAFRKISNNTSRRYPLNQALFEAWSVILSQLSQKELEYLISHKDELIDKFIYLIDNDPSFLRSISQASEQVETRFDNIIKLVNEVLP